MENENKENENLNNGSGQENKVEEFNPNAFMQDDGVKNPPSNDEPNDNSASDDVPEAKTDDAPDDNSNEFTWDSVVDLEENAGSGEEGVEKDVSAKEEDKLQDTVDKNTSDNGEEKPSNDVGSLKDNESFKQLNEQLGTKFETLDEMKDHLIKLENQNKELLNNNNNSLENDRILNLKKLKENSDEELVRMDLERQGFKGESLDNAVDKIMDNGMIEIEAKKILNTIDRAIKSEQNKITQSNSETEARQQEEYQESVKALTKHINETETMFGFKMAKDDDGLKKVRAEHQKYIVSGDFLSDITGDEKSISEAAWLWKNRDTILKAIGNREYSKGKADILKDIGNPELPENKRFKGPKSEDGFDPSKFISGNS